METPLIQKSDNGFLEKIFGSELIEKSKDYLQKISTDKSFAAHQFEKILMSAKSLFLVIIIILSVVNFDTDFIYKAPKDGLPGTFFAYETLLFGLCGAIGFSFIQYLRQHKFDIKSFGIFFSVFAILNILLQLSGVWTIVLPKESEVEKDIELENKLNELSNLQTREYKNKQGITLALEILVGIIFIIFIGIMLLIAYKLQDTVVEGYGPSIWTSPKYWLEAFVFASSASLNFYASARWRTGKVDWSADSIEVALLFVKFFILHNLLQLSGVYNQILFPTGSKIKIN